MKDENAKKKSERHGISELFIRRPITTTLVMVGFVLFGLIGYAALPVSDLPTVDYPTINVNASLPGANPETMTSSVATPLERQFGRIAGVTEMTSSSQLGRTGITLCRYHRSRFLDALFAQSFGGAGVANQKWHSHGSELWIESGTFPGAGSCRL